MRPQDQDDREEREDREEDEREDREEKESEEHRVATGEREHLRHGRRESVVWWLVFLQAFAAIVLGVLLLAFLLLSAAGEFEVLSLLGAYWLVSGLFVIVRGFSRGDKARSTWLLVVGGLSIVAGILALAHLISTTSVIILTVLSLLMGGLDIERHRHDKDVSALVFGFLNILAALGLLLIPLDAVALLAIALGLGGLVAGIVVVILSFRSPPSSIRESRAWIPVLLLGLLLLLCAGLEFFDIDIIERQPPLTVVVPQTVIVSQTVTVPQMVPVLQTVPVTQTVVSKETIIVPQPVTVQVIQYVTETVTVTVPQTVVVPQTVIVMAPACLPSATATPLPGTAEFLRNGRFEEGFGVDGVPSGWFAFNNGGERVAFSNHDDTWTAVVIDCHSALIEIDTRRYPDTVPDRFAGIGQTASGLQSGAQYQFSMVGEVRTGEGDSHTNDGSYYVEWGIDPSGGNDWRAVSTWNRVPWNHVYYRSSPGTLADCGPCRYSVSITAPSSKVTLFVRLYKKWAVPVNELLLNLDNLSLAGPK